MSDTRRRFVQLDVFSDGWCSGNALAVVQDARGLSGDDMARLARWTNLSETSFLLPPTEDGADYLVRIFTPAGELPFAGHPTLGSAWAWRDAGAVPARDGVIVQQCGVGLVEVRADGDVLRFAAPPRARSGPADPADVAELVRVLGLAPSQVRACEWADNGPGWIAVEVADVDALYGISAEPTHLKIGAVAFSDDDAAYHVRAFFPVDGAMREDPVTGSLNASVAQWLVESGRVAPPYIVRQGRAMARDGVVHISADPEGQIWVGGAVAPILRGEIALP